MKQLAVRMPDEMHSALRDAAYYTDRSMNDLAVLAIGRFLADEAPGNETFMAIVERAEDRYRDALDKLKDC